MPRPGPPARPAALAPDGSRGGAQRGEAPWRVDPSARDDGPPRGDPPRGDSAWATAPPAVTAPRADTAPRDYGTPQGDGAAREYGTPHGTPHGDGAARADGAGHGYGAVPEDGPPPGEGGPRADGAASGEPTARAMPVRIEPAGDGDSEPEQQHRHVPPPRNRRRKKGWLVGGGALLVVIVVAAGLLVGVPGLAQKIGVPLPGAVRPTAAPPTPKPVNPAIRPLAGVAAPTATGVRSALASVTANPALAKLSGVVLDPRTGNTLWQQQPTAPLAPGSTQKLLTSAAALLTMDPDTRLTTTVVQGPDPSTAVLVGGGDPTINSLPPGQDSIYWRSPHLADLVAQVRRASGGRIHRVLIDQSRYTGQTAAPGWLPADIQAGNYAPIVPAMLDGGRADPTMAERTPRTANPGGDLLTSLARGIGASAGGEGAAPRGAKVLGRIQSAPLSDLVANLLTESDNVLAEVVGRELARRNGLPPTFAGAVTAVKKVLSANGFDMSGVSMSDCSGLSTMDKIPATSTAAVLRAAAGGDPRAARLSPILDGLPVAGGTGTLAADGRYQSGASASGKGYVRAKTGTLDGVNALSGLVQTDSGAVLAFTFMSNGSNAADARGALDAIAARLRGCGCD